MLNALKKSVKVSMAVPSPTVLRTTLNSTSSILFVLRSKHGPRLADIDENGSDINGYY
jgi:hypothetical protein